MVIDGVIDRILRKYFYLIQPYFGLSYGKVSVVSVDGGCTGLTGPGSNRIELCVSKKWKNYQNFEIKTRFLANTSLRVLSFYRSF